MPFFFSTTTRSPTTTTTTTTDHENDVGIGEGNNAAATASNDEDTVQNKRNSNNSIGTRIRTFLLLHVLTALLPPVESKEELKRTEYYKVLGLDDKKNNRRNVTAEQIRKAYKAKSLALHPDKVAQRQARRRHRASNSNNTTTTEQHADLTEDEAAELFLKVQEAHTVLSDEHNRHVYHEFGCSPARYKFVHDSEGDGSSFALHHPMMLYENLQQASCVNKTRLVSVFTLVILLALLQPILICSKINQELKNASGALQDTPWSVILIPFWIVYGVIFMSMQLLLTCCWLRNNWQVRWFALQHLLFLIGMILLVQVWDGSNRGGGSNVNWHAIATPFYLCIFCRVAGMAATARDLLDVVYSRMASLEHLQQTEPRPVRTSGRNGNKRNNNNNNNNNDNENGADMDEDDDDDDDDFLTEDEWIAQLSEKYVIVTPDPQIVEAHIMLWHEEHDHENNGNTNEEPATRSEDEIPEEEMESIRIASSHEYQSAMEQVQALQRSMGNVFLYGIVMVALIAAKLTPTQLGAAGRGASWWAIFTPIWIYLALQMMSAVSLCCCSGLAAGDNDSVIFLASAAAAAGATGGGGESQNPAGHDVENQQQQQQQGAMKAATSTSPSNKEQFQDEHKRHNQDVQKQRLASSVNWANAEGSMDLPSIAIVAPTPIAAATAAGRITPKEDHDGDDDNASLTPSDEGFYGLKKLADPPGMLADEVVVLQQQQQQQQQQQDPPQQDPPGVDAATALAGDGQGDSSRGVVSGINPASNGGEQQSHGVGGREGDGHDAGESEMPPPHHNFDEETYHRWQQAHAAAESSAHEAQAKGQWQCCVAIFQLIVLCLAVGKLQDDYHPEQQPGDDPSSQTGYNAFWILFPIFFVAGIVVCCCSCLIYSAGSASGLDDLVVSTKKNDEADNHEGNVNQPGTTTTNNNMSTEAPNDCSSAAIPLAAPSASTEATTMTTSTQGEIPGQPVVTKHQATAAGAVGAYSGGGDIENAMDDLD